MEWHFKYINITHQQTTGLCYIYIDYRYSNGESFLENFGAMKELWEVCWRIHLYK